MYPQQRKYLPPHRRDSPFLFSSMLFIITYLTREGLAFCLVCLLLGLVVHLAIPISCHTIVLRTRAIYWVCSCLLSHSFCVGTESFAIAYHPNLCNRSLPSQMRNEMRNPLRETARVKGRKKKVVWFRWKDSCNTYKGRTGLSDNGRWLSREPCTPARRCLRAEEAFPAQMINSRRGSEGRARVLYWGSGSNRVRGGGGTGAAKLESATSAREKRFARGHGPGNAFDCEGGPIRNV